MNEILNFTKNQEEAVTFDGQNILLSAGAGSGKTFTLTQRIIWLLKNDPKAELSRFLIVTFTDAAANQLKNKIGSAITKAAEKDPKNKHLASQIAQLETAQISTMHSFFRKSLLPYHTDERLKMPPNFGILDEVEANVIRSDVMRTTLNELYEIGDSNFLYLADTLSSPRTESGLEDSLIDLYLGLIRNNLTIRDITSRLDELANSENILETDYYRPLKEYLTYFIDYYVQVFTKAELELQQYPEKNTGMECLRELIDFLNRIINNRYSYDSLRSLLSDGLSCSKLYNSGKFEVVSEFKTQRDTFKDVVAKKLPGYFSASSDEIKKIATKTSDLFKILERVLNLFEDNYLTVKRDIGKVDYSDLETFSKKLFANEDGTPTDKAKEIGAKYDYMFIDEYQDTSAMQNIIFSAIAEGGSCKRFTVGDVKQSIYGFRGACPQVFNNYRDSYENGAGKAVFMSENFRCDKLVIDISNIVSRYIFTNVERGKTPFCKEDELVFSKEDGKDGEFKLIVCDDYENEVIANEISKVLNDGKLDNGEKIKPQDIAVLFRNGTHAEDLENALKARGIPVNNSASQDVFSFGEILLLVCFINTIDNPLRDIFLTGALKSPMFGFTLNEIVKIRGKDKIPVWYSLNNYYENPNADVTIKSKLKVFIEKINMLRDASRKLDALEITNLILIETGFLKYEGEENGGRTSIDISESTKIVLKEASAAAKDGGGITDLVKRLNALIESKTSTMSFVPSEDSVNMLTIHKSKGLEFPVVFICNCGQHNSKTITNSCSIDSDGNAAMKLYDNQGLVQGRTPLFSILNLNSKLHDMNEEARILYVAMTRAREKLFMCGKNSKKIDDINFVSGISSNYFEPFDKPFSVLENSYMTWLANAMAKEDKIYTKEVFAFKKENTKPEVIMYTTTEESFEIDEYLSDYFNRADNYHFEEDFLYKIPQILVVSALKPDVLNIAGENPESIDYTPPIMEEKMSIPNFMSDSTKIKGTDIGTATHIFMQFINWKNLVENGFEFEKDRLITNEFLSKEDAKLVPPEDIEKFRNSELIQRMIEAKKVIREKRFTARLPACEFTTDPELKEKLNKADTRISIRGVIDCMFYDKDDKLVLVDYKTDRLTEEEKKDKLLAAKKLIPRHKRQLDLYSEICKNILGRNFDEIYIYSIPLGDVIDITTEV